MDSIGSYVNLLPLRFNSQSSGNCEFDISRFEAGRLAYDLSSDIVESWSFSDERLQR